MGVCVGLHHNVVPANAGTRTQPRTTTNAGGHGSLLPRNCAPGRGDNSGVAGWRLSIQPGVTLLGQLFEFFILLIDAVGDALFVLFT